MSCWQVFVAIIKSPIFKSLSIAPATPLKRIVLTPNFSIKMVAVVAAFTLPILEYAKTSSEFLNFAK